MINKNTKVEIMSLQTLKDVTYTYQQVAAIRTRKIRDAVIQTRDFYNQLSKVYLETTNTYAQSYKKPFRANTNGKRVAILVSSNTGLYGDIIKSTFNLFATNHANDDAELIVTGRLGRKWLELLNLSKPFKYYDMPDGPGDLDSVIREIFTAIIDYDEVLVYHGLFNNIASQTPKVTIITQKPTSENVVGQTLSFIFEPSIDKVLDTFEKQLLYSFFDQAVNEANLAKFGSRMMSLDKASDNISKKLELYQTSLIRSKHLNQNKKQLEQTCANVFWQ